MKTGSLESKDCLSDKQPPFRDANVLPCGSRRELVHGLGEDEEEGRERGKEEPGSNPGLITK